VRIDAARVAEVQVDLRRLPADQQELRGSLMMHGYNFTERVRRVLALAREEASGLHHEYVGTEHILLGVLREGGGTASSVITNFGVNSRDLRTRVIELARPASRVQSMRGPDLPYTSRAKKTLELAMSEARGLHHDYVGTEHLLLGLLHEGKGVGAQALNAMGITLDGARKETIRVLVGAGGHLSTRRSPHSSREGLAAFPQRLREVIADAFEIAAERGSADVTQAHAMIALLEHGDGMANTALDRLKLDRGEALFALNDLAPRTGVTVAPETVMSASSQLTASLAAMEDAQHESRAAVPGTQHLLLGILATSSEIAAILVAQGISLEATREEIRRGTG
jgi:ATP-dependent Clp protease ATP-binding subunit ClpC